MSRVAIFGEGLYELGSLDVECRMSWAKGESLKEEKVDSLFGLIKKKIEFANFDRVVIYVRFAEDLPADKYAYGPGDTMLKLFQNVPRADIEMLFPNTKVEFKLLDKLKLGLTAGGGTVAGLMSIIPKFFAFSALLLNLA